MKNLKLVSVLLIAASFAGGSVALAADKCTEGYYWKGSDVCLGIVCGRVDSEGVIQVESGICYIDLFGILYMF